MTDEAPVPAPGTDTPGRQRDSDTRSHLVWPMVVLYGGGAVVYAAWQFPPAKEFIQSYWPVLVMGAVAIVGLILLVGPTYRTQGQRVAWITFGLIPLIMITVGALLLLPPHLQVPALRSVFLVVVTLLPPTMYYLFIATRKYSLLKEYVGNLARLGLLDERDDITDADGLPSATRHERIETRRRLRVLACLQKFEGVYGPLPADLMNEIRATGDAPGALADPRPTRGEGGGTAGVGEVFTSETTPALVLSTVLLAVGWLSVLPPWEGDVKQLQGSLWNQAFETGTKPVHYAFLGAYFFSLQMIFRRYVLRDLRASAYVALSLRIILAVLATWVLEHAWYLTAGATSGDATSQRTLLIAAFVVGVFPQVAWQYLQSALKTLTGAKFIVPSLDTQLPVSDLDGLTVWHKSRLEEEDIENIPNMATSNLVDFMLHTRVPANRMIDWVDQAILYTHIGAGEDIEERRKNLRACGIRTASSFVDAFWSSKDPGKLQETMKETVPLELTVGALCTNRNLRLVQRWRGLPEEPPLRISDIGTSTGHRLVTSP
jgi:uncharacterized membrane protein